MNQHLTPVTEHEGKRGCLLFSQRGTEAAMALFLCLSALPLFLLGMKTHSLICGAALLLLLLGSKVVMIHSSYVFRREPRPETVIYDNSGREGGDAALVGLTLGFFLWDAHLSSQLLLLDVMLGLLDLLALGFLFYGVFRIFGTKSRLEIDVVPLRPGRRHRLRLIGAVPAESYRLYLRYLKEERRGLVLEGFQQAVLVTPGHLQGQLDFVLDIPEDGPSTTLAEPLPGYWELRVTGLDQNGLLLYKETFLLPIYRTIRRGGVLPIGKELGLPTG